MLPCAVCFGFYIILIGDKYMKYFRKFQANKEKNAENKKAILAKTSQRAWPPVWPPCVGPLCVNTE